MLRLSNLSFIVVHKHTAASSSTSPASTGQHSFMAGSPSPTCISPPNRSTHAPSLSVSIGQVVVVDAGGGGHPAPPFDGGLSTGGRVIGGTIPPTGGRGGRGNTGGSVTGGTGTSGGRVTGGLIGGRVTGGRVTGGLIGGRVTGGSVTGGLIGGRVTGGLIGGRVTGGRVTGGLIGGRVIGPLGVLGLWGLVGGLGLGLPPPQGPQSRVGLAVETKNMEMKRRAVSLVEDSILVSLPWIGERERERERLMMGFLELFIFSLISVASQLRCCNSETPLQLNDDVLGLIVFKSDLHDPSSHLASWNEDDNSPCSWQFIQCNPNSGRVTQLSLDGLSLSGKLGRGLERLQNLKVLSLSHNNFTGNLNPDLPLIPTLEHLNLSHNSLSGRIPSSFTNTSGIKFLDLSENSLSGPLPDDVFESCSTLRVLSLSGNLFEGPIPSTLAKCTTLNHLNLSNNRFDGNLSFATQFWLLTRLRTLDLSHNALSGPIPEGVSALYNLKEVFFQGNHFSGSLPNDIGLCPHLSKLDFSNNLLTGSLPQSLHTLSSLTFFSIANNLFTGEFPQWIGSLTSLEYLDFSGNSLTGVLPSSMGDLQSLTYLSLSDNRLSGSIFYSNKLSVIKLRGNLFNGSIPEGLFDLGLDQVDLSCNELTGSIPRASSSKIFETLQWLDLSENRLDGNIPAEMGLFSKLVYLNLSWNSFQSRMPPELGYFQNLTVLDLRGNSLNGSIPGDICDSGSLGILQVDGNSLTGPIPEEIGNCSSLYLLSLSHNSLSGPIPESISKLKRLKILKLEYNQLSGEIPQELGMLENLLAVNISYNRLQGRLPGGIFQSLVSSAMEGNLGICSPLLKGPCKLNAAKPLVLDPYAYVNGNGESRDRGSKEPSRDSRHRRFFSVSAIIAILAAALIAVGVVVISLLNISAKRRLSFVDNALESMCSSSTRSAGGGLPMGKLVWFDPNPSPDWLSTSPDSLLNKAAEVGEGVFGTVYKASLKEERNVSDIAIKKLVVSNMIQYQEDFDREVRILGKARHQNLVSLKGYYWTPQLQLLLTDYVPNRSLQAILHERPPSTPSLSWATRFKIVLGTANGLAHLHHSFRPPIIHYNIKPSNILLDENFNPKISDFGLTRLLAKLDKHLINSRFQSALGYVAPELACQSIRVNEKCDIYAFGVLILELVTGRRPIEYGEDNVLILNEHVQILLEQGNVLECVDQSMGEYPEEEVLPVLKLALVCTSQIPSSRPSMAEVVQILQVIKTPVSHRMEAY